MKIACCLISIGSICCIGLAFVCCIPHSMLLSDTYSDTLFDVIPYLFRIGLVLGVIAIFAIFIARTYWRGLIPAITSVLACAGFIWMDIDYLQIQQESLKSKVEFYNLKVLGEELIKYAETNSDCLPSAENWCDLLLENNAELSREIFKHQGYNFLEYEGDCQIAFNKNLSEIKLNDIPDDVILLFWADGPWNLTGTSELLKTRYIEHGSVALLFADQTVKKYWFYKQGIRKVDENGAHYEQPKWSP